MKINDPFRKYARICIYYWGQEFLKTDQFINILQLQNYSPQKAILLFSPIL